MKKITIYIIISIIFMFTGCGTKNIEIKIPKEQLMTDINKSYIVFSRPPKFVGSARDIDVMEIDLDKKELINLVGMIGNGERIIYPTNPGTHYFFLLNVGLGFIGKVEIEKGEKKYVDLSAPLFLDNKRAILLDKIKDNKCDNLFMKRFLLKEDVNKKNYYNSPLKFEVKCEKDKILSLKDTYFNHTIEELEKTMLVRTSEKVSNEYLRLKNTYTKKLKDYYPIWDFKFKNILLSESPIVLLDNILEEEYLNKFDSIEIVSGNHNKKMDQELINEYIQELKSEFNTNNSNDNAIIRITFDKYDNGNMFERYIVTGLGSNSWLNSMGVIDFKIEVISKDKVINTFRIYEIEAGGFLGGINTLKSDTMNVLTNYINNNLLK